MSSLTKVAFVYLDMTRMLLIVHDNVFPLNISGWDGFLTFHCTISLGLLLL